MSEGSRCVAASRCTSYELLAGRKGTIPERGVVAEDGCREYNLRTVLAESDLI